MDVTILLFINMQTQLTLAQACITLEPDATLPVNDILATSG